MLHAYIHPSIHTYIYIYIYIYLHAYMYTYPMRAHQPCDVTVLGPQAKRPSPTRLLNIRNILAGKCGHSASRNCSIPGP